MRKFAAVVFVLLAAWTIAFAQQGYYVEQTVKSSGAMGMGGTEQLSKSWYTKNMMRTETSDKGKNSIVIIRIDQKKVYNLNPAENTYWEMPLEMLTQMSQMGMSMIGGGKDAEVSVQKTGQTRKINNWNCREVLVTMGNLKQHVWVSDDIKIPSEYYEDMMKYLTQNTKLGEALFNNKDLSGFPVLTETEMNMMGMSMKSSTEMTKFEKVAVSEAMFSIPDGYRQVDNPLNQMKNFNPNMKKN